MLNNKVNLLFVKTLYSIGCFALFFLSYFIGKYIINQYSSKSNITKSNLFISFEDYNFQHLKSGNYIILDNVNTNTQVDYVKERLLFSKTTEDLDNSYLSLICVNKGIHYIYFKIKENKPFCVEINKIKLYDFNINSIKEFSISLLLISSFTKDKGIVSHFKIEEKHPLISKELNICYNKPASNKSDIFAVKIKLILTKSISKFDSRTLCLSDFYISLNK